MNDDGVLGKLYVAFDFVYRLIYLNLLWFSFTLIGAFIFGIGPSTIALYHVIRKWLRKELGNDQHIFKDYLQAYKDNFIKGNIIGLIVIFVYFMFLVNYRYATLRTELVFQFIRVSTVILAIITTIMATYLAPLYVHYKLTIKEYFQKSFVLAIAHPLPTLLNVVWLIIVGYLFNVLFPFSLLLGVSCLAYGLMGITYSSFVRNDRLVEEKLGRSLTNVEMEEKRLS